MIRVLPAAVAAPFTALLSDRYRRENVLFFTHLFRALGLGAASAAILLEAPAAAVYAIIALVAVVSAAFRPAQWALLPRLSKTPEQLAACNVTSSMIEGISSLIGPIIGGVLLATTSPGVVLAASAGKFLSSAIMIGRIQSHDVREPLADVDRREIGRQAFAGFRAVVHERDRRTMIGLISAATLARGALNVLLVVAAIELLGLRASGVGFLTASVGVGGLAGAAAALALVGRARLASPFGIGMALWGLPLLLIAAWPEPAIALLALPAAGAAHTLMGVSGLTLLRRTVPDDVLARVFGVLESLATAAIAAGGAVVPLLLDRAGPRWTLMAVGALLPALAGVTRHRLRLMDESVRIPARQLELLARIPMFEPLPAVALEHLAGAMTEERFGRGTVLVRQGDAGDHFYVIAEGEAEVSADGRPAATLGPGDSFGEIALLRSVPRTATVTARTDIVVYALDRDEFIGSVTGHVKSAEAADAVVGTRLAALGARVASL